jgi:hypothetical protein
MRFTLLAAALLVKFFAFSQATDLIISEYVEGSGSNKYIELYNGTGSAVNLANYELRLYANGSSTPTSAALSGTLANGATIVYKNSAATAYSGTATVNNTITGYNGDDAIALFKTTTSSFVDIVGNIGCDPGTAWTATGGFSTLDKTLTRNANVCSGVTTDPTNTSCPFPTLATEWTVSNIDVATGLGSHTMSCVTCTPGAAPTTPASDFSATTFCTTAQISFTGGNGAKRIAVVSTTNFANTPVNGTAYTANTVFGSGSTIGAGNFVVLNGTATNVTITGLTFNTTYYLKVFEYNGVTANCDESYLTAGVTAFSFTTQNNCGTPQIRSVLVDACSSQEGLDELVVVENGGTPLAIGDITINFPSGGSFCNTGCSTNTLENNATYVSQLNAQAGCSLFQYADPIPAGGIIVLFTGLTPSYVFDYSTQCPSSTTYYAIFCNNSSTAGRFANSGTGTRTLDITFGANSDQVTYNLASTLGDGTFVDFDSPGNAAYRQETNCIYPLAVELDLFDGYDTPEGILLDWRTLSEKNADYFSVEHADYTADFKELDRIACAGSSNVPLDYHFIHGDPVIGINYYRLKQYDFDGAFFYSPIVAFNHEAEDFGVSYLSDQQQLSFSKTLKPGTQITLYQSNGQFVHTVEITAKQTSVPLALSAGMWMVRIVEANGQSRFTRFVAN